MNQQCENCKYEPKINELDESVKSNSAQHKDFYDKFEKLHIDFAVFTTRFDQLISMINNLQVEVKTMQKEIMDLKEKPAKRWDSVVATAISAVVGGLVGYLLMKGGFK